MIGLILFACLWVPYFFDGPGGGNVASLMGGRLMYRHAFDWYYFGKKWRVQGFNVFEDGRLFRVKRSPWYK